MLRSSCPGKQDYKQIVVAVRLDAVPSQAAERGYFEVQSNFINPTENAENDPLPGASGKVVTAQQFYLTDTPCSSTGATARQEIVGNHLLHNTLGTCASGPKTGTTKGAPDALAAGKPAGPRPRKRKQSPLEYDYSNDFYLDTSPDAGTGVQIRKDDTNGCHYVPTGTTNPESQIHRWVTDPMVENFVMTEKVTLEFYTRSLNNNFSTGRACVFLYKRHEAGSPLVATDTMLTNTIGATAYWTYTPETNGAWPQDMEKNTSADDLQRSAIHDPRR